MNLVRLAGFAKAPSKEQVGSDGMAALVAAAEQMLRAGVSLTTDFWMGCEDYEREAIALAGDRLAASRAALVGIACTGPRGVAMLTAHQDGGLALKAIDDAEELQKNKLIAQATADAVGGIRETVSPLTSIPTTVMQ